MLKGIRNKLKSNKGVTLAECIVSIAILAIISTMAYQAFSASFSNINKKQKVDSEMGTAAEKLQVLSPTDTSVDKSADTSINLQATAIYSKTNSQSNAFVLIDGVFVPFSATNTAHSGLQRYTKSDITSTATAINGNYYTYTEGNVEYTVFVAAED